MTGEAETAARILGLLDLTSLGEADQPATVERLCARTRWPAGRVAAVCVWPRFVPLCRARLAGSGVRVATVANFPAGDPDIDGALRETRAAIAQGAEEVDLVFPYGAWLAGRRGLGRDLVAACKEACGDLPLKVILETGRLVSAENIAAASRDAIEAGADFLKTSTGKIEISATLAAAETMLRAIRDSGRRVGFKAAGGIRTADQAIAYLALAEGILGVDWASPATFRFGASGLLDDLLERLSAGDA